MYRYTLTVPEYSNELEPYDASDIERQLAEQYGGYTKQPADGAWVEGDRQYNDRNVLYSVDTDRASALARFQLLAAQVKREARQQCVYLTRQPIEQYFV